MNRGARRDAGFSLLGAIFLLVVLASISVYLLSASAVQRDAAVSALLGTRARLAAGAGLEWALDDVVNAGGASLACSPPGTVSFTLTGGALAGFDVDVSCTATAITEGSRTYVLYALESAASRGILGSPGYVNRRVMATAAF